MPFKIIAKGIRGQIKTIPGFKSVASAKNYIKKYGDITRFKIEYYRRLI